MPRSGLSDGVAACAAEPDGTANGLTDPDLIAVVKGWDTLPDAVRVGIMAMVRAAASPAPKS